MRLAPVVLFYFPNHEEIIKFSGASSRTTHAAPEAVECCHLLGHLIALALQGAAKSSLLGVEGSSFSEPKVVSIARGEYAGKSRRQIFGTGYSVASLEAALWCFQETETFQAAVLEAANLGDDSDTTAAIVGQLAGAFYGAEAIPSHWLNLLHMRTDIEETANALTVPHMLAKPAVEPTAHKLCLRVRSAAWRLASVSPLRQTSRP